MKRLIVFFALFASITANAASTLLFKSGFESATTINTVSLYGSANGGEQTFTGTDATSGFNWASTVLNGTWFSQQVACNESNCVSPNTSANLLNFNVAQIQSGTDPTGKTSNLLYTAALGSDDANQTTLMLGPSSEPSDFYISFWIKFQPDLLTVMAGGDLQAITEWKSSGDFRELVHIESFGLCGANVPHFALYWDNVANGGLPYQQFLSSRNCTTVISDVSKWYRIEKFTHRDNSTGRVLFIVDGTTHTDHTGDNIGVNSNSINRIIVNNTYGSAMTGENHLVDNIEVWDGLPPNPSLTDQTVASVGDTTGTPQVTTNIGAGTMYMVVVPSGDFDSLTNAQRWALVKQGKQSSGAAATGAEIIEVFASGAKSFAQVTGLTSGLTYDTWLCHWTTGTPNCVTVDFTTTGQENVVRPPISVTRFNVEDYRIAANDDHWRLAVNQ